MQTTTEKQTACSVCTAIVKLDQINFLHFRACSGFHIACYHCAKKFQPRIGNNQNFKCHLCREKRQFGDQQAHKSLQNQGQIFIQEGKTQMKGVKSVLVEQINEAMQEITKSFSSFSKKEGLKQFLSEVREMMRCRNYDRAISLLTWIITNYFEEVEGMPYLGLGSSDQAFQWSDFQGSEWYWQRYGHNLSPYDQLGLCFLLRFPSIHQRDWFRIMCKTYPSSFKLLYGFALTEHNLHSYEAAVHLYTQVIKMEQGFSKPYEMLAFIYHKLGQREKALAFAEKCLNVQNSNIFAKLIKAKLHKQTDSQICQDLQQLYCLQPTYLHIINEIIKKYFVIYDRKQRQRHFQYLQQRQAKQSITCYYTFSETSKAQYYKHAKRILVRQAIHPGRSPKYVEQQFPSLNFPFFWYPETAQLGNPFNYLNLAIAYNDLRFSEKTIKICQQYLNFYPQEPSKVKLKIKMELLCAQLHRKDVTLSQKLIEELSSQCKQVSLGEMYMRLGNHFEVSRDLKKSIEWYNKCMRIGFRWNWCCIKIFRLLIQQQRIRQAEDMIDEYVAKNKEIKRNPFVISKTKQKMLSEIQWVIIDNKNKFNQQDTRYFCPLINFYKSQHLNSNKTF